MNKNTIVAIVALGVLALGIVWWMQSNKGSGPAPLPTQSSDITGMIIQDVDELDLGDIDREFQDIDTDLQTL